MSSAARPERALKGASRGPAAWALSSRVPWLVLSSLLLIATIPLLALGWYWLQQPATPIPAGAFIGASLFWVLMLLLVAWTMYATIGRLERARSRAERQLAEANVQGDILLREVHHRVKNSMQIVASLVSLHASRVHEGSDAVALSAVLARINALASIHREMYAAENLEAIELGPFLAGLLAHTARGTGHTGQTRLTTEPGTVTISPTTALPLGMLTLELIDQALCSQATDGPPLQVDVFVRALANDRFSVTLRCPAVVQEWQSGKTASLGQTLVTAYARQLHADLTTEVQGEESTTALTLSRVRDSQPAH